MSVPDLHPNIRGEVDQLNAPTEVKEWMYDHLDKVSKIDDPIKQGEWILKIGGHLFQMKFSGVVTDDAATLETLLDFARISVAPEITREEGYKKRTNIINMYPVSQLVSPKKADALLKIDVELDPIGRQISQEGQTYKYSFMARVGIVNIKEGKVIRVYETFTKIPSKLPANQIYKPNLPIGFSWKGVNDSGIKVKLGDHFFMVAVVQYLELDDKGNIINYLDQAATGSVIKAVDAKWFARPVSAVALDEPFIDHFMLLVESVYEKRVDVIEDTQTFAIIQGNILETKSYLISLPPNGIRSYDIITRVVADVPRSFNNELVGQVEFWVHGGILDVEDWIPGIEVGRFTSEDARLEVGDEVFASIQECPDPQVLPDGSSSLLLNGFNKGVTFLNTEILLEQELECMVEEYLVNNFEVFNR